MAGPGPGASVRILMLASTSAVALALAFGTAPARGQAKEEGVPAAKSLRLAVVDMDKVLERSEEWQDCQEEYRRLLDKTRRTLDNYDRQVRILRSDYENLPPGTDAAAVKRDQLEATLLEFGKARDELERQLSAQRTESLRRMYGRINTLVEEHAKANDIDLVLKKQSLRASTGELPELNVVMATADVLYVKDSFDITDAIVERLNAAYPGEIKEK